MWDPVTLSRIEAHCGRFPDAGFSEQGAAIARILAAGIAPADLATINCATAYQAVLGTLYAICEPGVDDNDVFGLYEELGMSPAAQWHPPTTHASPA